MYLIHTLDGRREVCSAADVYQRLHYHAQAEGGVNVQVTIGHRDSTHESETSAAAFGRAGIVAWISLPDLARGRHVACAVRMSDK